MRFFALGAALLLGATGAIATPDTPEDDFVGELSNQEYQTAVRVDGDNLVCHFISGDTGYIPVSWATAYLILDNWDQNQVLHPTSVGIQETEGAGNPETLCEEIDRFKASAGGNYVEATKTSEVRVALIRRYGGECDRQLIEKLTVRLSDRLVFTAINSRILSGGSSDPQDCLESPWTI